MATVMTKQMTTGTNDHDNNHESTEWAATAPNGPQQHQMHQMGGDSTKWAATAPKQLQQQHNGANK